MPPEWVMREMLMMGFPQVIKHGNGEFLIYTWFSLKKLYQVGGFPSQPRLIQRVTTTALCVQGAVSILVEAITHHLRSRNWVLMWGSIWMYLENISSSESVLEIRGLGNQTGFVQIFKLLIDHPQSFQYLHWITTMRFPSSLVRSGMSNIQVALKIKGNKNNCRSKWWYIIISVLIISYYKYMYCHSLNIISAFN